MIILTNSKTVSWKFELVTSFFCNKLFTTKNGILILKTGVCMATIFYKLYKKSYTFIKWSLSVQVYKKITKNRVLIKCLYYNNTKKKTGGEHAR